MRRGLSAQRRGWSRVLVTLVAAPPAPAQGGGVRFAVLPFENTGSYGQDREVFEGLELAFPALLASALDRHPAAAACPGKRCSRRCAGTTSVHRSGWTPRPPPRSLARRAPSSLVTGSFADFYGKPGSMPVWWTPRPVRS